MLRPLALAYLIAWFGALYGLPERVENEVQLFMASHYLDTPFNLWDTRWYGGFDVSFRPPGFHVLIAGLARVPGVGLERAYALGLITLLVGLVAAAAWLAVELGRKNVEAFALAIALNPAPYALAFNDGHGPLVGSLTFAAAQAASVLHFQRTKRGVALLLATSCAVLAALMHPLGMALAAAVFLLALARGNRKHIAAALAVAATAALTTLLPWHGALDLGPRDAIAFMLLAAPLLAHIPRLRAPGFAALLLGTAYLLGESAHAAPVRRYREALAAVEEVLSRPDARGYSYIAYGVGAEDLALSRRTVATLAGGALPGRAAPEDALALPHLRWVITVGDAGREQGLPAAGFRRAAAFGGGVVLWERNVAPASMAEGITRPSHWWTLSTPLFFLIALASLALLMRASSNRPKLASK